MRSFTGRTDFDDTLPLTDGELETGFRLDLEALRKDMEDWMSRKFGGGRLVELRIVSVERFL